MSLYSRTDRQIRYTHSGVDALANSAKKCDDYTHHRSHCVICDWGMIFYSMVPELKW